MGPASKDGAIKQVVQRLSPCETHVVAFHKPSDRDRGQRHFPRYILHLLLLRESVLADCSSRQPL
ncbi:hypothetical protein [Rhizorhapis sp. SPR117]|uniref:hypothetical protein n=1 Tax=Rhizorhapis sp. SPR117 TaxID=2912611 RepID=UPI00403EB5AA